MGTDINVPEILMKNRIQNLHNTESESKKAEYTESKESSNNDKIFLLQQNKQGSFKYLEHLEQT